MSSIQLENIKKSFGKTNVLKEINIKIEDGEFVCFVGPSGCGKSTLLRIIAGLEDQTSGEVFIDGENVSLASPAQRGIGMVFQTYALYPHLTVHGNMALALKQAKVPKDEIKKRITATANMLQIDPLLARRPAELSGGQRQRVAIGRAIVREPKVLLLDEPLSNLDAALRLEVRLELAKLHEALKSTMVYVTHDQIEAMTLADRIIVLKGGIIQQSGKPNELYRNPDNIFVAGFIGSPSMNFLQGKVTEISGETATVKLPNGNSISLKSRGRATATGQDCKIGIRPEHIDSDSSRDCALGKLKIDFIENMGASSLLHCNSEQIRGLTVYVTGNHQMSKGDELDFYCNSDDGHLFTTY